MNTLYSHSNKKKLKDHLYNVGSICKNKVLEKDLNLSIIEKNNIADLSYLIGVAHDFGKATSHFQKHLFHNYHTLTHHGLISSFFGYVLTSNYFSEKNELFPIVVYMIIRKHHGNLESYEEKVEYLIGDIKKQLQDMKNNTKDKISIIYNELLEPYNSLEFRNLFRELENIVFKAEDGFAYNLSKKYIVNSYNNNDKAIELFLITNLLYSILINTDKNDAAGVSQLVNNDNENQENVSVKSYIKHCRQENPEKFCEEKEINKIRNKFFYDVLENSDIDKEQYLYTLTAPTGIGKTFSAYAFANKIKDLNNNKNRIIYCLPYTSIIDQNHEEIEKILKYNLPYKYPKNSAKYLFKHHYLAPPVIQNDQRMKDDSFDSTNFKNYFNNKLIVESWESINVVTTFVQLLESIIGNKNSYLKKFHKIINSVIILDEVQNIPVDYYDIVGKVITVLAKKFNTYILLMTATQPMLIRGEKGVSLVDEKKYAMNSIFNRVKLKIVDNLKNKSLEEFIDYFKNDFNADNGLIVCNTIGSALKIYDKIVELIDNNQEYDEYKVFSLTTYLTPADRAKKINIIKDMIDNNRKIIVVSTQLIEAGVDISFEVVFRDMGPLDSIIQTAGRTNRSGELFPKKGYLKLVSLADDSDKEYYNIYPPKLISFSKEILLQKDEFESRDFLDLSRKYFKRIEKEVKRESQYLLNAIKSLNYSIKRNQNTSIPETPIKNFKLIEGNYGKEDIIICCNKKIEEKIYEIEELYKNLNNNWNNESKEYLWAKMEIIKKELSQYRVSVYSHHLDIYKEHGIIKSSRYLPFVDHNDQKEYLYSKDKGFLVEPKKDFQNTIFTN